MMKKKTKKKKSSSKTPLKEFNGSLSNLRMADLELFITAAQMKNLGQAAVLHCLSQSAASTAILRVEAAFGRPLCMHEKRQFRLTREGSLLLPRAELWVRSLKENVATQDPLPVRIVTTHAIARVGISAILSSEKIDLKLMRPDRAYGAVLRDEADVALVLDNAPWEGLIASEISKGSFQLYAKDPEALQAPVLLPEDQIEGLTLQQRWQQVYRQPLAIKARVPSWSLIADICASSSEVGFLPDFLALKMGLHPVSWQPAPSKYRLLALYKSHHEDFQCRLDSLISIWRKIYTL
jgi:DNA-binding transcriptional LysR family regulator